MLASQNKQNRNQMISLSVCLSVSVSPRLSVHIFSFYFGSRHPLDPHSDRLNEVNVCRLGSFCA